jgi:hypothetical protein
VEADFAEMLSALSAEGAERNEPLWALRSLGDDLAVLQVVDRCPVLSRGSTSDDAGAAKGATRRSCEL